MLKTILAFSLFMLSVCDIYPMSAPKYQTYLDDLIVEESDNHAVIIGEKKNKGNVPAVTPRIHSNLPVSFRTTSDNLISIPQEDSHLKAPSLEGLNDLHVAGSGQFTPHKLKVAFDEIKVKNPWVRNIAVFDLRRETHGFINDIPTTLFVIKFKGNLGKYAPQIIEEETKTFHNLVGQTLKNHKLTRLPNANHEIPIEHGDIVEVVKTQTEKEVVEGLGGMYYRIPVQDSNRPNDQELDSFIRIVQSLPADTYIVMHCAAGLGRTTTFMVLADFIKNAKKVPFEDILVRQFLLGGIPLLKKREGKKLFKADKSVARLAFLENFYDYCKSNNDNFTMPWSKWLAERIDEEGNAIRFAELPDWPSDDNK